LLGEKIYIPGGLLQNGQPTNVLEVYDPRTNSWQPRASLPVPLSAYALAAFEGRLYLFGGKRGDAYSVSVYSYDPEEDLWEERSPLSSPRAYAGTAVINGKIFVTGGYDGQHAVTENEAYFPNRDESGENAWEEFAPLPEGRYGMGVTGIAAFIVLAGGKGDDGQDNGDMPVLQYIPLSNQWSVLNTPPQAVGAFPGLVSSGNFVYVLGGEQQDNLSDDNQAYQAIYTISAPIIGGE
jgi:N-acetylneuraminic acid mutarotase